MSSFLRRHQGFFLGLGVVLIPWGVFLLSRHHFTLKNHASNKPEPDREENEEELVEEQKGNNEIEKRKVLILYGTCTGTARRLAENALQALQDAFKSTVVDIALCDAKDYDDFLLDQEDVVLFVCSTWTDGVPPESAQRLVHAMKDYAMDFRVSKSHLAKLKVAVFGLGGSYYNEHFCQAAKEINGYFVELGATLLLPVATGDDSSEMLDKFQKWTEKIVKKVKHEFSGTKTSTERATVLRGNTGSNGEYEHKAEPMSLATVDSPYGKGSPSPIGSVKSGMKGDTDGNSSISTEVFNTPSKHKKNKGTTNGSGVKVTKANAFQIQQQLVRAETKAAAAAKSSSLTPTSISNHSSNVAHGASGAKKGSNSHGHGHEGEGGDGGCCQESSSAAREGAVGGGCCNSGSEHAAEETGRSCCQSDTVPELLPPDDDEEEEDRINDQYIRDDSDFEENEEDVSKDDDEVYEEEDSGFGGGEGSILDLEDIGAQLAIMKQRKIARHDPSGPRAAAAAAAAAAAIAADGSTDREMVTKLQRRALTKEGYRIIGSHSAVKLCRWTKNQMRGRGGCYKHTFYGITSYQCMEATPSLACANKCVFCWRHHKNPVGTDWRWKTDEPLNIVEEAVELHRAMINEMRGVPGVLPGRLTEGLTVKHCALSLVGEPIMYPRINEMIRELHRRKISSFLVTNAQFPERIQLLEPVTQLYVSVDAATRDSLKAIDRPLFKDFWERFLASLEAMKEKKQRTVYRLTLVKSWNMEEAEGYVKLIEMGQPDFIEIKSVTYCGKSDASSLTMQNVPWHQECCQFSEAIANRLAERGVSARYSIATEHEHSCCILLAREDRFKINGEWYTWINYEKYHQLIQEYYESGGMKQFSSVDYMEKTPEWALYQSETHGFDPKESRWKRNKAGNIVAVDYKSSDSGCG